MKITNLLGIDFEEWYHPELVQPYVLEEKKKPMVVKGLEKILDLLRKHDTSATFFFVGEIIQTKPEIIDKITSEGHELAFHTMHHSRLDSPSFRKQFEVEVKEFASITQKKSKGFRAPSFSLNQSTSWAIDVLAENNYLYDSSVVPAKTKLYGIPNAQNNPYKISSSKIEKNDPSGKLMEFPLLTTRFLGKTIPASGGFYLRVLPIQVIENAIKRINSKGFPASIFIHSWELTPEFMPKISVPIINKFVTFYRLKKAYKLLERLLIKFEFSSVSKHLENQAY